MKKGQAYKKVERLRDEIDSDIKSLSKEIETIHAFNSRNEALEGDISKNIMAIDTKIKSVKASNRKNIFIRNIKIFGRVMRLGAPVVISTAVAFGIVRLIGDIPFYRQQQKHVMSYEETFDNKGNIHREGLYRKLGSSNDSEYKYLTGTLNTGWELHNDGKYYRTTKEYEISIDSIDIDKLKEVITGDINDVDAFLGNAKKVYYDVKTELTEEEKNEKTSIEFRYRYDDMNDIVFQAQADDKNDIGSAIFFLIGFVPSVVYYSVAGIDFGLLDKLYRDIEKYRKNYQKVDIKNLEKLFKEEKIKMKLIPHEIELPKEEKVKVAVGH